MRWMLCILVLVVTGFSVAAEDKPSDLKVEASGLRVIAPFSVNDEALNAFGSRTPGTTATLLITSPSDRIVHFDHASSTITPRPFPKSCPRSNLAGAWTGLMFADHSQPTRFFCVRHAASRATGVRRGDSR